MQIKAVVLGFVAVGWLGGCAMSGPTTTAGSSAAMMASAAEAAPPPPSPPLPNLELSQDILGQLLVADIAIQRGQFGVALDLYRQLAFQTRDPRLAERAARVAVFARDDEAALSLARLWVELDAANLDARQILAALLVRSGDFEAAQPQLDRLLASSADEEGRYMLLIRLLGREQDKEAALQVMDRYLARHADDPAAYYAYGQLALRAGKLPQAEQAVDKLLALKPDWAQGVILRTRILQAANRDDAAIEYLGQVVGRHPADLTLAVAYGRMLVAVDRPEDALKQFERVLKAEPNNEDVLFAAGLVALRLEKVDQGERYFLRLNALGARPDETSFYLGRIEEFRGHFPEAIRWYEKVSEGENYLQAKIFSAVLQARQGDVDGARAQLQSVQARNPGQRLRLFLAEGEILRSVDRNEEAMSVYDRALEEIPGNNELLYARAMVADKLGRLDILERDLLEILERQPDHVDALNSLGYTLADRTTRYDEALIYIKRAMELRPDTFYILDSMGWVNYRLGRLAEAADYLRKAIKLNFDPEIAAHLGEVLWVMGDRQGARDVWKSGLEKAPENKLLLDVIKRLEK